MNKQMIPAWAIEDATPGDRVRAHRTHSRNTLQVTWSDRSLLREWARNHGWPAPRFGFENTFLTKMLDTDDTFALAVTECGIETRIPKQNHTISADKLSELDVLYEQRSEQGQPIGWGVLVEELRDIRRAVEAGVIVNVKGSSTTMKSWQSFYDWAHGRNAMLEDGYDSWMGDDDS